MARQALAATPLGSGAALPRTYPLHSAHPCPLQPPVQIREPPRACSLLRAHRSPASSRCPAVRRLLLCYASRRPVPLTLRPHSERWLSRRGRPLRLPTSCQLLIVDVMRVVKAIRCSQLLIYLFA